LAERPAFLSRRSVGGNDMKSIRSVWKPLAVTMGALVALVAGAGPAQASVVLRQTNLVQPVPFPQHKKYEPAIAQNPTDATNSGCPVLPRTAIPRSPSPWTGRRTTVPSPACAGSSPTQS